MSTELQAAAQTFHRLHHEGFLVLANAWDAATARLIESLGAKAIATTSAAVAWSHGYADGDLLPVPLLRATVAEIARVIRVPLSVDIESGYSDDPAAVADVVTRSGRRGRSGHQHRGRHRARPICCAPRSSRRRPRRDGSGSTSS